jgi:hypothetical protein
MLRAKLSARDTHNKNFFLCGGGACFVLRFPSFVILGGGYRVGIMGKYFKIGVGLYYAFVKHLDHGFSEIGPQSQFRVGRPLCR